MNNDYTVSLAVKPDNVTFQWFNLAETPIDVGPTRVLLHVTGDSVYLVQPVIPETYAPYNVAGGFPKGKLTVWVANKPGSTGMRWTGLVSTDWYNPNNWVDMRGYELPVAWTPTHCVDVVIPPESPNFPELTDSASCAHITIQDRAMFKNPHVLSYTGAQVELKLKPSERDRFVMWSAPLRDMYSGDYHFKIGGDPQWGDVHMNLFQQDNPAGGGAQANMFTATFGQLGEALELGKAFNLQVTTTTRSRDQLWIFPQPDPTYPGLLMPLGRTYRDRFITQGTVLNPADTTFTLNISGNNTDGNLVQVVNPYLAWLDITKFLSKNSTDLYQSGYIIWNGNVNNGFTTVKFSADPGYQPGMRYVINYQPSDFITNPNMNLIPPLQSFFVQKRTTAHLGSVKMSPNWTTTQSSVPQPFYLRSASVEAEKGVLHIQAVQGNKTGYTALQYDPAASPAFNGDEDVRTLFYDEIPLTLYSLTARQEPLAINASGDFHSTTTDLGLRIMETGEIRLAFTGLETFGHNVYLIDREKNNAEINLQQTPEYTFVAVKPSNVRAVELNDRFTLRMDYTGVGNLTVDEESALLVSGNDGYIHVRSTSGVIRHLWVFNLVGKTLYNDQTVSNEFKIPVERAQMYIVKALIGNRYVVKKVVVR
jgi:hypothetical protein